MKERLVNRERAVVAHYQPTEIAEPGKGAFHGPPSSIAAQPPAILRRRSAAVFSMRSDQRDAALRQLFPQRVAVIATIGDETEGLLPGTPSSMPPSYPDRSERRRDELDLRRGRSVKVVSQRKTLAVDHHHPLRALAPLGLADRGAPFLAGAKLPSINDSLHRICCRSFNSPRKTRQISRHTSCSSQSRNLRQHVEGAGNSSGKSCQRAPLRKIHKMPSSTLRSFAGGRPPFGRGGRRGSRGWIFAHWASVSNRPYRAIGPPSGATYSREPPPRVNIYPRFTLLYRVLKWLLRNWPPVQVTDRTPPRALVVGAGRSAPTRDRKVGFPFEPLGAANIKFAF
jgi:hypothetical protein